MPSLQNRKSARSCREQVDAVSSVQRGPVWGSVEAFGFSLDAVKHWEGGRRQPEVAARAYLTVIAKEPEAVMRALGRGRVTRRRTKLAGAQDVAVSRSRRTVNGPAPRRAKAAPVVARKVVA
jgi:hypothetical protein